MEMNIYLVGKKVLSLNGTSYVVSENMTWNELHQLLEEDLK